jgi:hypothetical protein
LIIEITYVDISYNAEINALYDILTKLKKKSRKIEISYRGSLQIATFGSGKKLH